MTPPATTKPAQSPPAQRVPPLENDDHLTREEFETERQEQPED